MTKTNHPRTNSEAERVKRTIKEPAVKLYHGYCRLCTQLAAYNFTRRPKTLNCLTSFEDSCKIWKSEAERLILNTIHPMLGLNT